MQMHSRQFGLSPALNGMCLGLDEELRNGKRIIGHGGDTIYFHSDLHLVLENGVGFFVSYKSAGKGDISPAALCGITFSIATFLIRRPELRSWLAQTWMRKTVAGRYLTTRRSESSFLKVGAVEDNVTVTPDENGTIKVEPFKDFNGQIKKWQEIAPLVYRSVDGEELLAFVHDATGTCCWRRTSLPLRSNACP